MNTLHLGSLTLTALPSGGLWWPDQSVLCVSDLHLGKSERMARRGGSLLPPYETAETLDHLAADLDATAARTVICLGDSFDDLAAAASLAEPQRLTLLALMAGRDWIWIEGNHDPGPVDLGGRHLRTVSLSGLAFRHVTALGSAGPEVSGHYHPKAAPRGRGGRPCFLGDGMRLILPAYGRYTGGMPAAEVARRVGLGAPCVALLAGRTMVRLPITAA